MILVHSKANEFYPAHVTDIYPIEKTIPNTAFYLRIGY